MVWLSYYEEYPIYEPAEGGYYYAGLALIKTERLSKRAAKRKFDEIAREYIEETKNEKFPWIKGNGRFLYRDSYYIGEGAMYCVEHNAGEHEKGYQPYC